MSPILKAYNVAREELGEGKWREGVACAKASKLVPGAAGGSLWLGCQALCGTDRLRLGRKRTCHVEPGDIVKL